jgi:hypothetical protein
MGEEKFIPSGNVLKVPTSGGYFLEFEVSSFSEFYIASQSLSEAETPLPVKIISFRAFTGNIKGKVNLEWKTASETNCDRFELHYSCDGNKFKKIQSFLPMGSENKEYTYRFDHYPEACTGESIVYQLLQFENGETTAANNLKTSIRNSWSNSGEISIVNPATKTLKINGLSGITNIQVLDLNGRILMESESFTESFDGNISFLAQGYYYVKTSSNGFSRTFKLVKD